MQIRIGKTQPPAAAPLGLTDIVGGIRGLFEGGQAVSRFEEQLRTAYRTRYCFAVSSGKAALVLILRALKELFPGRDQVLIPAYTCYSVPAAIARAGLQAVPCDLARGSLDYDFDRLAEHLAGQPPLCVIATHLFGVPADVERIRNVAARRQVPVVEDAAQAMGAQWNGRKLGTVGDVGLFSMGRGKAFSTVEGGVILTDNERIGTALSNIMVSITGYDTGDCLKLIAHAIALSLLVHPWLYWLPKSLPFLKLGTTDYDPSFPIRRLSPFQAGLACRWPGRIELFRRLRRENASAIVSRGFALPGGLEALPDLIRFPLLMPDRGSKERLLEYSERRGLGISAGYPDTVVGIADMGGPPLAGDFPAAQDIAGRIVSLPVHPFVRQQDIDAVAQLIKDQGGRH
ncbi:DegT/DnrJ/EryC1/StrS aminotransferase family protein [Geobacter sp. SVR]|uniref:DegT/DnrJ/EryC1/StrS family aminotransferase n=1 Tax=Geobacter sp. SVR TaxID=2495594 RepID=UPI00143EF76F|nr:DegT/DnrJ/EryC1/StrS family aminotransferase [Geobacter sp. SVR]BCS54965.1 aminotransferase [Geobacter sp. SVR]GCF86164.1 aminotransferase [Geobacter sp. SVR]